eukprot:TRINITY_DN20634_c0_g1_i1.p1 TRINITY_DN20634_c0_g1~~TRINITY_DN20634_c0_g1_i1.p1  ORF type:complete len:309 (-),score=68.17 TRINITY_DN20634_c0_g1_i1:270-1196(-)
MDAALVLGGAAAGVVAYKTLSSPAQQLQGRVCLITGGGSGVGLDAAVQFARQGCKLILWDINQDGMDRAVLAISRVSKQHALTQVVDVSDPLAVYAAAAAAADWARPSHISILVNNAGIVAGKGFMETSDQGILKTFQVNALAHVWCCKAFLPAMIAQKQGHIVTVASAAGLTCAAQMVPYGASKHAAVGFAHGLRKELRQLGHDQLRTSLICPALIKTKLFDGFEQPLIPALSPLQVADEIVGSVRYNRPYRVMPGLADPSFLQCLPIWMQDKLESLLGLDNMMSDWKMEHSAGILGQLQGHVQSKL